MPNRIISEDIQNILSERLPWEKLKDKSILITGANGFLPAYLVYVFIYLNRMHNYNIKLYLLCRNQEKSQLKFAAFLNEPFIHFIFQDVSTPIEILDKIDIIIHAASQASPKYYGIDPVGTMAANITGTSNLLDLAHRNKCENFLYFSSSEVYGSGNVSGEPRKENNY